MDKVLWIALAFSGHITELVTLHLLVHLLVNQSLKKRLLYYNDFYRLLFSKMYFNFGFRSNYSTVKTGDGECGHSSRHSNVETTRALKLTPTVYSMLPDTVKNIKEERVAFFFSGCI